MRPAAAISGELPHTTHHTVRVRGKLACTAEARRAVDLMFHVLARTIWLNHTTNNQSKRHQACARGS